MRTAPMQAPYSHRKRSAIIEIGRIDYGQASWLLHTTVTTKLFAAVAAPWNNFTLTEQRLMPSSKQSSTCSPLTQQLMVLDKKSNANLHLACCHNRLGCRCRTLPCRTHRQTATPHGPACIGRPEATKPPCARISSEALLRRASWPKTTTQRQPLGLALPACWGRCLEWRILA